MDENIEDPAKNKTPGKPATKGWPPERRAAQAARIRETKPWLKATGPKTAAGKKRCSQNAVKHGNHSGEWEQIRRALKVQRQSLATHQEFMRLVMTLPRPVPASEQTI